MNSTTKIVTGTLAFLVLAAILLWWLNSGYGQVSDKGYAYAMALMSICNRQDEQRLVMLVDQLQQAEQTGELAPYDLRVLKEITSSAGAGHWQTASNSIRQLMEDQVHP